MSKQKGPKIHKNVVLAFVRISESGGFMSRQSSLSEDAQKRGAGYIYYTPKTNRQISPMAARFLIEKEIVKPVSDGLFDGQSQSFKAISREEFHAFKELYEQVPVRQREARDLWIWS